jgi:biotin-(acetyl-CoA carboxylase) ligase
VDQLKKAFVSNIINQKYSFKNTLKEWNKYAFNKNKFINFKTKNKIYRGVFRGINNKGALILQHNNRIDYFTQGSIV